MHDKNLKNRLVRFWLAILIALGAQHSWAQNDALLAASAMDVVQHALTGRLDAVIAQNSITKTPLAPAELLRIVRQRLNPALLEHIDAQAGATVKFFSDSQKTEERLHMIVLNYPDEETAAAKAKILAPLRGAFRGSPKTIFSCARSFNQLTIVFSQDHNDPELTKFVMEAPRLFATKP